MPQLVKGCKHTFGWSRVGDTGRIVIPPEALEEYNLNESEKMVLVPGSQTSGGFGIGSMESVKRSHLGAVMDTRSGLGKFSGARRRGNRVWGEAVLLGRTEGRRCCHSTGNTQQVRSQDRQQVTGDKRKWPGYWLRGERANYRGSQEASRVGGIRTRNMKNGASLTPAPPNPVNQRHRCKQVILGG